jgi:hypothetical protein
MCPQAGNVADQKNRPIALRCLGKRWSKILWRLWTDRTTYDETRHQENQKKHGYWVIALLTPVQTNAAVL